jgi:hypothetical protein
MKLGLVPHSQPVLPVEKFVAFLSQIPPRGSFLPVAQVYNCHAVNNLPFYGFHGMEEVIGSIPIRSTNKSLLNIDLRHHKFAGNFSETDALLQDAVGTEGLGVFEPSRWKQKIQFRSIARLRAPFQQSTEHRRMKRDGTLGRLGLRLPKTIPYNRCPHPNTQAAGDRPAACAAMRSRHPCLPSNRRWRCLQKPGKPSHGGKAHDILCAPASLPYASALHIGTTSPNIRESRSGF